MVTDATVIRVREPIKMKITIERFGPIDRFEYDLSKELIVTYGNNNIGKSYAMQMVYLLLKTFVADLLLPSPAYRQLYLYPRHLDLSMPREKLEYMIKTFMESDEKVKDITSAILSEFNRLIATAFMPTFMNACENTFGNLEKTLEKEPLITIDYEEYHFTINLKNGEVNGNTNIKPVLLKKTDSDFHKSRKASNQLTIFVVDNPAIPSELVLQEIQNVFMNYVRLLSDRFGNVYFLPASRSGIYAGMNAFGSIVAELSRNRAFFTKKIEFPGISEPISDYFIALSNIKTKANERLEEIYTAIEREILKGKVIFDKNKNAIMYEPDHIDASYEMTEVSSMVSEISPIVAFLKYIIPAGGKKYQKTKSILFIEEPEAHLHPNNQIALMEVFARLIGADVKLIMSSHSNYVFNKINNLILAKKLNFELYGPIVLEETASGSVSKHITVDELGADDENFSDVSADLYYEREEIIDALNMED